MFTFEEICETACAKRSIPNAIVHAADRKGNFEYAASFGVHSTKTGVQVQKDAVLWIASCTKLMTCVAVLQCVERGLLKLDEDVSAVLHEFKELQIITGFDTSGQPILKKAEKRVTLRHLLTHSSGVAYDVFHPTLMKYRKSQGRVPGKGKTVQEKYTYPLLYEPGTAWSYGASIDWAGLMVERVNDGISLEDYMKAHIWKPLGIKDMTFHLEKREDLRKRMVDTSERDTTTSKAVHHEGKLWDDPVETAFGGAGVYSSIQEYMKILQSLLNDDGKLLMSETLDNMFKPQLSSASRESLMKQLEDPELNDMLGSLPLGSEKDWGLSGLLLQEDVKDGRRKGTLSWGGAANSYWWIDRENGLSGIYGTQMLPLGDTRTVRMFQLFERVMYERFANGNPRL